MNATKPEIIYIYNENCVMAGREVPQSKLLQYDDPTEGQDWTPYIATEEEAKYQEDHCGAFGRKIAATLRKYL